MSETKNFYLICYDIRDPKRWRKAHQLLKGYGETLQYSIFRCRLTQREREKLRWELEEILTQDDSLLVAGVCDQCVKRIQTCNRPEVWTVEHECYRVF